MPPLRLEPMTSPIRVPIRIRKKVGGDYVENASMYKMYATSYENEHIFKFVLNCSGTSSSLSLGTK